MRNTNRTMGIKLPDFLQYPVHLMAGIKYQGAQQRFKQRLKLVPLPVFVLEALH
jgi:hypothetical protein